MKVHVRHSPPYALAVAQMHPNELTQWASGPSTCEEGEI